MATTRRKAWFPAAVLLAMASPLGLASPVQWATNGHWYEGVVVDDYISWPDAQAAAVAKGGYLATLTSAEENTFVFDLVVGLPGAWTHPAEFAEGPWLGGSDAASEGNWQWVTGEPWGYAPWFRSDVPDDWGTGEDYLCFWSVGDPAPTWNDASSPQTHIYSYVVEYGCAVPAPAAILLGSIGVGLVGHLRRRRSL